MDELMGFILFYFIFGLRLIAVNTTYHSHELSLRFIIFLIGGPSDNYGTKVQ